MSSGSHARLRAALLSNAAFSAMTGTVLAARPDVCAPAVIPISPLWLRSVGFGLVGFAIVVALVGVARRPDTRAALAISLADLGWVLGTVALPWSLDTSLLGTALIGGVNLVVLPLAIWQVLGIDRAFRYEGPEGTHRICMEVPVGADPDRVFAAVSDLGAIAEHMPSLRDSRLRAGGAPGEGAVRQCEDHRGKRWAERCTRLDRTRRELDLAFLTDEPGFPYPFRTMRGGWKVLERDGGASVQVWWIVTPRVRWLAPLLFPVMVAGVRRDFPPVVRSMAGEASAGAAASGVAFC